LVNLFSKEKLVEVIYKNDREKSFYQDIKALRKDYGDVMAKLIMRRIAEIESHDSVGQLLDRKIGKAHMLTDDYKHCVGISLTGNYRLIIKPVYDDDTDFSQLKLRTVHIVKVMEVIDYHGN